MRQIEAVFNWLIALKDRERSVKETSRLGGVVSIAIGIGIADEHRLQLGCGNGQLLLCFIKHRAGFPFGRRGGHLRARWHTRIHGAARRQLKGERRARRLWRQNLGTDQVQKGQEVFFRCLVQALNDQLRQPAKDRHQRLPRIRLPIGRRLPVGVILGQGLDFGHNFLRCT